MDNEKIRAEFEAHTNETYSWSLWEEVNPDEPKTLSSWNGQAYTNRTVQAMWRAWQASRAALVVALPFEFGNGQMKADSVIAALNAAGITVKEGV